MVGLPRAITGSEALMTVDEKVQVIEEFTKELKAATQSFLHPHIDGVTAVIVDRLTTGLRMDGKDV